MSSILSPTQQNSPSTVEMQEINSQNISQQQNKNNNMGVAGSPISSSSAATTPNLHSNLDEIYQSYLPNPISDQEYERLLKNKPAVFPYQPSYNVFHLLDSYHHTNLRSHKLHLWFALFISSLFVGILTACLTLAIGHAGSLKFSIIVAYLKQYGQTGSVSYYAFAVIVMLSWCLVPTVLCSVIIIYISPGSLGSGIVTIKAFLNGLNVQNFFTPTLLFWKTLATSLTAFAGIPTSIQSSLVHVSSMLFGVVITNYQQIINLMCFCRRSGQYMEYQMLPPYNPGQQMSSEYEKVMKNTQIYPLECHKQLNPQFYPSPLSSTSSPYYDALIKSYPTNTMVIMPPHFGLFNMSSEPIYPHYIDQYTFDKGLNNIIPVTSRGRINMADMTGLVLDTVDQAVNLEIEKFFLQYLYYLALHHDQLFSAPFCHDHRHHQQTGDINTIQTTKTVQNTRINRAHTFEPEFPQENFNYSNTAFDNLIMHPTFFSQNTSLFHTADNTSSAQRPSGQFSENLSHINKSPISIFSSRSQQHSQDIYNTLFCLDQNSPQYFSKNPYLSYILSLHLTQPLNISDPNSNAVNFTSANEDYLHVDMYDNLSFIDTTGDIHLADLDSKFLTLKKPHQLSPLYENDQENFSGHRNTLIPLRNEETNFNTRPIFQQSQSDDMVSFHHSSPFNLPSHATSDYTFQKSSPSVANSTDTTHTEHDKIDLTQTHKLNQSKQNFLQFYRAYYDFDDPILNNNSEYIFQTLQFQHIQPQQVQQSQHPEHFFNLDHTDINLSLPYIPPYQLYHKLIPFSTKSSTHSQFHFDTNNAKKPQLIRSHSDYRENVSPLVQSQSFFNSSFFKTNESTIPIQTNLPFETSYFLPDIKPIDRTKSKIQIPDPKYASDFSKATSKPTVIYLKEKKNHEHGFHLLKRKKDSSLNEDDKRIAQNKHVNEENDRNYDKFVHLFNQMQNIPDGTNQLLRFEPPVSTTDYGNHVVLVDGSAISNDFQSNQTINANDGAEKSIPINPDDKNIFNATSGSVSQSARQLQLQSHPTRQPLHFQPFTPFVPHPNHFDLYPEPSLPPPHPTPPLEPFVAPNPNLNESIFIPNIATNATIRLFVALGVTAGLSSSTGSLFGAILYTLEDFFSFTGPSFSLKAVFTVIIISFCVSLAGSLDAGYGRLFTRSSTAIYWPGNFFLRFDWDNLALSFIIGMVVAVIGHLYINLQLIIAKWRSKWLGEKSWYKIFDTAIISLLWTLLVILVPLAYSCIDTPPAYKEYVSSQIYLSAKHFSFEQFICPPNQHNELASYFITAPNDIVIRLLTRNAPHFLSPGSIAIFLFCYVVGCGFTSQTTSGVGSFVPTITMGAAIGRLIGCFYYYMLSNNPPELLVLTEPFQQFHDPGIYAIFGIVALFVTLQSSIMFSFVVIEMVGDVDLAILSASTVCGAMLVKHAIIFYNTHNISPTTINPHELALLSIHKVPFLHRSLDFFSKELQLLGTADHLMHKNLVMFGVLEQLWYLVFILKNTQVSYFPIVLNPCRCRMLKKTYRTKFTQFCAENNIDPTIIPLCNHNKQPDSNHTCVNECLLGDETICTCNYEVQLTYIGSISRTTILTMLNQRVWRRIDGVRLTYSQFAFMKSRQVIPIDEIQARLLLPLSFSTDPRTIPRDTSTVSIRRQTNFKPIDLAKKRQINDNIHHTTVHSLYDDDPSLFVHLSQQNNTPTANDVTSQYSHTPNPNLNKNNSIPSNTNIKDDTWHINDYTSFIDLAVFSNRSHICVPFTTSTEVIYKLFSSTQCNIIIVIDNLNNVIGIITRFELIDDVVKSKYAILLRETYTKFKAAILASSSLPSQTSSNLFDSPNQSQKALSPRDLHRLLNHLRLQDYIETNTTTQGMLKVYPSSYTANKNI